MARGCGNRPAHRCGPSAPEITDWFDRIVEEAQAHHFHLVVEDELRDPRSIHKLAVALRKETYVVQAVFVSTNRDESTLSVMAQYDMLRTRGLPSRFVTAAGARCRLGQRTRGDGPPRRLARR